MIEKMMIDAEMLPKSVSKKYHIARDSPCRFRPINMYLSHLVRNVSAKWIDNISVMSVSGRYLSRKPIIINEKDLEEKFVRGSGKGGQSINKTSSKVQLHHVPTGIKVSTQQERDLHANRKIARRLLKEKLDTIVNGDDSKIGRRVARIRRRKAQRSARARKKYSVSSKGEEVGQDEDDEEESVPSRPIPSGAPGWVR
jgi:protein subunit release factor B